MQKILTFLVVLLFCMLTCGMAGTYYVAPGGDDLAAGTSWDTALRTITNGVAKAGVGDDVVLSNGVYVVSNEVLVAKAITVRGWTGNREDVIVNGNYPFTTNRCFRLNNGSAVLADMTITNGAYLAGPSWSYGGSVYVGGGNVRNCLITGGLSTNRGGGIFINPGKMTNCLITGNYCANGTSGEGGGVYAQGATKVVDCVISNNVASGSGGGVYVVLGAVIENCEIVNNVVNHASGGRAGGVIMSGATLTNCLIANNRICDGRYHGGGGINGSGVIANCRIIGNNAGTNGPGGGASFRSVTSGVLVHDCVIVSNVAAQGGGIATHVGSTTVIRNCLISHNISTTVPGNVWGGGYGGGIYVDGPSTTINCTVAANFGETGAGGIRCNNNGSMLNCVIYTNWVWDGANHNIYNTGAGYTYTNCVTFPAAGLPGAGNIEGDPKFVDPAGNFRLRTRSPCIDAGLNQPWMDTAVDLDGNPRRRDGSTVDIGCYEYEPPPAGTVFFGL